MKPTEHYGHFDKAGKLHARSFVAELGAMKAKGVPVVLTVEEFRAKRSNPQNRYYWSVVVALIHRALNEGGIEVTREGTHDLLKFRFLKEDHRVGPEEVITTVRSTTELDKLEFGTYLDECIRFAAEYLNVVIPDAGEQMEMEINN